MAQHPRCSLMLVLFHFGYFTLSRFRLPSLGPQVCLFTIRLLSGVLTRNYFILFLQCLFEVSRSKHDGCSFSSEQHIFADLIRSGASFLHGRAVPSWVQIASWNVRLLEYDMDDIEYMHLILYLEYKGMSEVLQPTRRKNVVHLGHRQPSTASWQLRAIRSRPESRDGRIGHQIEAVWDSPWSSWI